MLLSTCSLSQEDTEEGGLVVGRGAGICEHACDVLNSRTIINDTRVRRSTNQFILLSRNSPLSAHTGHVAIIENTKYVISQMYRSSSCFDYRVIIQNNKNQVHLLLKICNYQLSAETEVVLK